MSPKPDDKSMQLAYATDGYDPFQSLQSPTSIFDRAYRKARDFTISWKKSLIQGLIPHGSRILDGGCGTGEFINSLKDHYHVEGYEPELKVAAWVQDQYELSIHAGDSSTFPSDIENFDLITMWHVLEHVPDPVTELHRLGGILNSGGKLLIAVPNITSADAMIYGSNWVALDAPRHLWHFSKKQISLLAGRTGFKLLKSGMLPLDVYYNSILSEKNCIAQSGFSQLALTPFRLPFSIISSILYGMFTGKHSSNYYVLEKK
jgi:2-polyprenyl-3-methyl-5-hydroxy-6-metoxy-1,4-benzoquinol methylase